MHTPKINHKKLTVGWVVNPYGQPDRKNTVFFYDFPKKGSVKHISFITISDVEENLLNRQTNPSPAIFYIDTDTELRNENGETAAKAATLWPRLAAAALRGSSLLGLGRPQEDPLPPASLLLCGLTAIMWPQLYLYSHHY